MTPVVGRGLGKLILCGEHAVVYGHAALAFAVDRATEVTVEPRAGRRALTDSDVSDPRLEAALDAVLPAEGLTVRIRSDLPVGRGMGSSAALAAALVRARAALDGARPTFEALFERALPVERVFHGNPSGLDVAVALRGGFLLYRRGPPLQAVPVEVSVPWQVVVLDTGRAGNTADLVAGVASRRPAIDAALERIGALVLDVRAHLPDPVAVGALLDENQSLLEQIGVSDPDIERLVALARAAGAHGAKLSGAGGGGIVIALVTDPEPVLRAARAAGVTAFTAAIGGAP